MKCRRALVACAVLLGLASAGCTSESHAERPGTRANSGSLVTVSDGRVFLCRAKPLVNLSCGAANGSSDNPEATGPQARALVTALPEGGYAEWTTVALSEGKVRLEDFKAIADARDQVRYEDTSNGDKYATAILVVDGVAYACQPGAQMLRTTHTTCIPKPGSMSNPRLVGLVADQLVKALPRGYGAAFVTTRPRSWGSLELVHFQVTDDYTKGLR